MQATPYARQTLLVAAPDDPLASELVTALRALGTNILVGNTIALASRADEFAICIVILRPGQWRTTTTVATAMRCNPHYMIPILAEPMPLPNGAWATEAINVKEPLSETAHELEALVNKQLQASSNDTHIDQRQQTKQNVQASDSNRMLRIKPYNANRRRLNSLLKYVPIFLLLVLFAGIVIYSVTHKISTPPSPFKNILSGGNSTSNPAFGQSYKAAAPGGCNGTDKNWWNLGAYFKTLGTPTATAVKTNTASKETPTPYVVQDNSTVATCKSDGLHVQHNDYYDTFGEVFFQGDTPETLPQHFSTQITATTSNTTNRAIFMLGVRTQSNGEGGTDRGYGDDSLIVGVDGSWRTVRHNDVTGQEDTPFTRGFVKPAQTMTLGAEVEGARITFSINGQKLLPIVDTTYPNGHGIGFGLADDKATSPPSAVYTNFSYQPLDKTNLTNRAAAATAIAQASQRMSTTYTTPTPGFGCDQNGGQWEPVTEEENYATASCQPNGLSLSQGTDAKYNGYESFYGFDGNLPTNYNVSVQIDTSQLPNGCAGLTTRTDKRAAGYFFRVCYDGYWTIGRYDSNGGEGQTLKDGSVMAQTSYTMVATSQGDVQSLSLGGVTVATLSDSNLPTTDHIELAMYAGQDTAGTAVFSNFSFTPLP